MIRRRAVAKSSTAFQDLLFLLLSGVTILWVLSFLLINPIAKQHDIESPAEFILTMEWDSQSNDDLDLWLRQPDGTIISFRNKDTTLAHLERDDLGMVNDCTSRFEDGVVVRTCIFLNREVITIRGIQAGEYQVLFEVFYVSGIVDGNPVTFEIIDVNPYSVEFQGEYTYQKAKQRISLVRFTIGEDGSIESISDVPAKFGVRAGRSPSQPPPPRSNPPQAGAAQ